MNAKRLARATFLLLAAALFIAACSGGFQPETITVENAIEVTRVVTETIVQEGEAVEVTRVVEIEVETGGTPAATRAASQPDAPTQRLIIKDGRITVVTEDTEAAVNTRRSLW